MEPVSPPPLVIHVIHGLTIGGAEIDLVGKLGVLRQEFGYLTTVVCLRRKGPLAQSLVDSGGAVIGPLMRDAHDPTGLIKLRRLLTGQPWDVVHSHMYGASVVTGLTLATLPSRGRPAWVVSEHSMAGFRGRTALRAHRKMATTARAFLVPTHSAEQSFLDRGLDPTRLRVLPNGLDTRRFPAADPAAARVRIRSQFGIEENQRLLGTVCRLHEVKNLPTLFRVAAEMSLPLLVVGDGPERRSLNRSIAAQGWGDWVRLLGSRSDVPDLLAAMDVFVLPSLSESMSLAVAEALLCGTPVVATRTGGVPEITGNGRFAALVPPGDAHSLREAIERTLSDLPGARDMATAGGVWVRDNLEMSAVARRLHELYCGIMASS